MKKILMILMIFFLSFALNLVFPYKQAHALGPVIAAEAAVPVGITIGAGAYTLGALGLGVLVGVAGYDTYSEEINAHALQAWENGTQLSKDAMNLMIKANVGLAEGTVALGQEFINWVEKDHYINRVNIALAAAGLNSYNHSAFATNSVTGTVPNNIGVMKIGSFDNGWALHNGLWNETYTSNFKIAVQSDNGANTNYIDLYNGSSKITSLTGTTAITVAETLAIVRMITDEMTTSELMSILNTYFPVLNFQLQYQGVTSDLPNAYQNGVSKTKEAWQDMKDAGLVLPVDSAIPVYQGNIATYNPTSDVYTGVDGGVIAKGDLTWSFPQPRIRTGEELDVTVPPGVYVDNPAGLYNPSLPTTAVPDVAIPTTTSITTGVTTAIPKTGTGEPPSTGGTTPKGEPLNPFKGAVPSASLMGLWQLLVALIWYLIRLFTFVATLALIAPTPIDNEYFQWFTTVEILGITPYPLVQNLALFFLGFSIYKSVRRVF